MASKVRRMMLQDRRRGAWGDTGVSIHVPVQGGSSQSCIGVARAAPESNAAVKQMSLGLILGPNHSSAPWLNPTRVRNRRVAAPAACPFSKTDAGVMNNHLREVPSPCPCCAAGQAALGRSWGGVSCLARATANFGVQAEPRS